MPDLQANIDNHSKNNLNMSYINLDQMNKLI